MKKTGITCFHVVHSFILKSSHLIFQCEREPPLKKQKFVTPEPAALCVAVHGDCAAVGYHGDGIKLFDLDTGMILR